MKKNLFILLLSSFVLTGCSLTNKNNDDLSVETQQEQIVNEPTTSENIAGVSDETQDNEPQVEFTIDMDNFSFSQTDLVVQAGQEITIKLNNFEGNHDLVIDELDAHSEHFKPGESGEMKFTVSEEHIGNTYEFYCSVGSHRSLGMVGTITVVE